MTTIDEFFREKVPDDPNCSGLLRRYLAGETLSLRKRQLVADNLGTISRVGIAADTIPETVEWDVLVVQDYSFGIPRGHHERRAVAGQDAIKSYADRLRKSIITENAFEVLRTHVDGYALMSDQKVYIPEPVRTD